MNEFQMETEFKAIVQSESEKPSLGRMVHGNRNHWSRSSRTSVRKTSI